MISLPASLERLAPPPGPRVEAECCVRRRLPEASCRRCAEACPRGAITLGRQPRIDPDLCSGCLLCSAACPRNALAPVGNGLVLLLPHLESLSAPVIGCRRPGVEAHARVACLGLLVSTQLLLLLTLRLPQGTTLNLLPCRGCLNAPAINRLRQMLTVLAGFLPPDLAARVRLVEAPGELRFEEEGLSRRGFFSRLRKKSCETTAGLLEEFSPPAPPTADVKRPLLLNTLLSAALAPLDPGLRQALTDRLFPNRRLGPTCRSCAGCVGLCPTGALLLDQGPGTPPTHHRQRCSGCDLCLDFCRAAAIHPDILPPAISPPI